MSALLTFMQLLLLFNSVHLAIIPALLALLGPAVIHAIPIMEDCSFLEIHTVAVRLDFTILDLSVASPATRPALLAQELLPITA